MALTTCPECSGQVSTEAQSCPHCGAPLSKVEKAEIEHRRSKHRIRNIFAFLILAYLAWSVLPNTRAKALLAAKNIVTLTEYEQCKVGMSYAKVVEIIGAEGTEQGRNELNGSHPITTVSYNWSNDDFSAMSAMFQNNSMIQKNQFMLK